MYKFKHVADEHSLQSAGQLNNEICAQNKEGTDNYKTDYYKTLKNIWR